MPHCNRTDQTRKENAASSDQQDDKAAVNDAYDILRFELKDLDNFSVSKRGITFLYDAGFPHRYQGARTERSLFFQVRTT